MATLGLNNAVQQYQQGVQWRQNQEDVQRQQARQRALDEANKAAAGIIDTSKAEWAMNGAQGQYTPNDATMFKAAEARGQALAKAGLFDEFVKNEALVAPQRIRVRSNALQRYEADGDVEALARAVYPTVFDGKEITGVERLPGAEGGRGQEASPARLRFKLSDGSTQELPPDEIVRMVKSSLVDPIKAAEQEAMLNLERAKVGVRTEGELTTIRERGSQDRQTAELRGKLGLDQIDARTEGQKTVQQMRNDGSLATAQTRAQGAENAARIRVNGSVSVAQLRRGGGGGGGGRGGLADASPKVQSRMTDENGNVILVMRDGTHKALVGDDGRPVRSLDYQKLVGKTATDIGRTTFGTPEENRAAAERMLSRGQPAAAPAAPGQQPKKDYSELWKK